MEAVWREGVRECVVASRIGKRRVDRRALTELSAPALHLGHCHAVVGGGHTFATEKLATCELANMFIFRAFSTRRAPMRSHRATAVDVA